MTPTEAAFFEFAWKFSIGLILGLWAISLGLRALGWYLRRRERRIVEVIGGGGVQIHLERPPLRSHAQQVFEDWEGGGVRRDTGRGSGSLHRLAKVRGGRARRRA